MTNTRIPEAINSVFSATAMHAQSFLGLLIMWDMKVYHLKWAGEKYVIGDTTQVCKGTYGHSWRHFVRIRDSGGT